MSDAWKECVNQAVGASAIADINRYVTASGGNSLSPIDEYYEVERQVLSLATPAFLGANPLLGPLLVVGLLSATENYVRGVLGGIIGICPIARSASAECNVHLGSLTWNPTGAVARGAFEHFSFAASKHVQKACRDFIGYEIRNTSRVHGVLDEFDKICELRHGVVHAACRMPGKNAIKLKMAPLGSPGQITIGYPELQECGEVLLTFVASLNLDLFEELAKRWATTWPAQPDWDSTKEHQRFKEIWNLFMSARDESHGNIPSPLSLIRCRNMVKKAFP